ncbi:MAG TPA: acylphosphatase [Candidatus Polarisedimenticolia bacterium]|nr:acylphosphatase [Candidatus Polarisedimenticolia bacterium]
MSATRFLVSGRVQGVGYRLFAVRAARGLGITGFARNLDNGQVEVVGQGSEEDLRRFEALLRQGPRGGRVETIESSDATLDSGLQGFEIRH